ncbi:amino acid adenylation domain-containing protein [Actinokineospora sp. HUAS TT18]|uniref:amino acid adenylation domain-containing protein n=1 Tax=Actinokineospora sp. HUAS TT18 TaxID=3447451 RepID=UPI003F525263
MALEPTLKAAFAAVRAREGDRDAVKHGDRVLTYDELARLVESAAGGLASLTAGRESAVVALVLDPSVEFVATVVGAVSAGLVYLPLDPASPDDYLRAVFAEADPAVIVTDRARADKLGGTNATVVTFDELVTRSAPVREPEADDAAYVIYTSGSTGKPKGVVVSHGSMINSTDARMRAYGVPTRMPLVHSVAFDLSSGILFWALLGGGTLIISQIPLSDVAGTVDLVRRERVTHLVYAASLYAPFLERIADDPPSDLVGVMIGSERWSEVLIGRHAELLPSTSLYNEYGPTEACVWSSYACVYSGETGHAAPLTIGDPLINTGYVVLDEHGDPLPTAPGVAGELAITGRNVAIGYLNRPDLTAERFIALPDGERAYRTGDLVEVTDTGQYVFVGRADRQIKIQGNRIEAAHVETALMTHSAVEQAHVMARASGTGTTLVGYLVPKRGEDLAAEAVRTHLTALLPPYMVPTGWVVLPELPRTRSGKIDESVLPLPGADLAADQGEPPADDVEQALVDALAEITGTTHIGVLTPLLEVGLNSLSHVRLSAIISRRFGIEIPMSVLFAEDTLRGIADHVRRGTPTGRPPLVVTARDSDTAPLSAQQHQIWFLHHLSPDALAYNTQFSLRLTGTLDVEVLERALSHIVERHEILRTTFHDGPDGPVQRVHAPWRVVIERVDLTGLSEADRAAAMDAHMRASMTKPFDIATLPLVRWHLYQLTETAWSLFQVEHHFAHDGWSASLFLREIRELYAAFRDGGPSPLPPLPVQYRDYARWYHEWRDSEHYRAQERYWTAKLDGCPTVGVTFAPDRPRPAAQTFNGDCVRMDIPPTVVSQVDELCKRYGVTRFSVFLSAFALLVTRHTGERDLVIGSALSNRRQVETAGMLGMFVNALPLRLAVAEDATVGTVVHTIMRVLLQAQDNQEFPLVELIKKLDLPRDRSRNPLFQLMFAFHDSPRPRFELDGLTGGLWIDHNGSAKNDVNVVCVPNPPAAGSPLTHAGINVLWEYNRDLFDRATAEEHASGFAHIVGLIAEHWDSPADVDLMAQAATRRVLAAATGPDVPPPFATLSEGVDNRVRLAPDAIALTQGGRSVTYGELDGLARHVERLLSHHGIAEGATVAVACPKSPELVAAWLAVLRRGANYVCLDPSMPPLRLAALVRDAAASAVLCTPETAAVFEGLDVRVIRVDEAAGEEPAPVLVPASATAYLTYTSGSTGTPKAVTTTHANAVAALHARTVYFGATPPRTLVTLPPIFDVAGSMVFWTLWLGGTVVFPDTDAAERDADAVRGLIDEHGITHVNFVASFYRLFVEAVPESWRTPLRIVAIGGEPCTPDLVARHADRLPEVGLHNEYGPTEATVWCSAAAVHEPGRDTRQGPITVGRPLANYVMVVLDDKGRVAPIGALGELYVGGAGVAAGYHQRPELTAERFVTMADGPLAGTRLYRTGDGARMTAAGDFEITGRLDDQVKVRGYRIETGEVQRCLADHPDVTAAFITVEQVSGSAHLAAFIAAPGRDASLAAELRRWAADRLPSYMVPSAYAVLDELPLTRTGKVDRDRLTMRIEQPTGPAAEEGATESQRVLLDLWRALLGRHDIGLDDDFFAVGGDSLQSIRLVTMARSAGMALSVPQILRARTVRALSDLVDSGDQVQVTRVRRAAGTTVALSAIQGWFFAQDFADPDHFNQARVFEVDQRVDEVDLRAAVEWTRSRHDAFRTTFRRAGEWTATLLDRPASAGITSVTLRPGDPVPQLAEHVGDLHRRISIDGDRLFEVSLCTQPDTGQRWLCLVAHHLIVDAVSWDVIARDIETAAGDRQPADRPAPGMPDRAAVDVHDTELDYWESLVNVAKPAIAVGDADPAPFGALRASERTLSPLARRWLLRDLPLLHGTGARAALLAALARGLMLACGRQLYVFLEGHGRGEVAASDEIVGWLTALYPVSLPVGESADLVAAAAWVEAMLAAVPAKGVGYGRARYLEPASPLGALVAKIEQPEITFNYLGGQPAADARAALTPVRLPIAPGIGADNTLPTPLDITVVDAGETFHLRFAHDEGRVPVTVVESALDAMVDALEGAASTVALVDSGPAEHHFLVHPVDGTVGWYRDLAAAVGHRWRCVGFAQSDPMAAKTVPDMAAEYVARLRRVQATGPYTITGWSFGAAVAFEMARQLESAGERVTRLTLADPPMVDDRSSYRATLVEQVTRLVPSASPDAVDAVIGQVTELPLAERAPTLGRALLDLGRPRDEIRLITRQLEVLMTNHHALAAWRPDGQVESLDLVMAEETAARGLHEPELWRSHSRTAIRVETVAGDHLSMVSGGALAGFLLETGG